MKINKIDKSIIVMFKYVGADFGPIALSPVEISENSANLISNKRNRLIISKVIPEETS